MSSWYLASVPIILAIVAIVSPFATARLRAKDARERLKADVELLALFEPGSVAHASLKEGVDRQAVMLTLALPDYMSPTRWNARRAAANFCAIYGLLLALGTCMYFIFKGENLESWWQLGPYCIGFSSLILGFYSRQLAVRSLSVEVESRLNQFQVDNQ